VETASQKWYERRQTNGKKTKSIHRQVQGQGGDGGGQGGKNLGRVGSDWKKRLLLNAPELFSGSKNGQAKSEEELTAPLYEEIGRLKMDVKWLKKKL